MNLLSDSAGPGPAALVVFSDRTAVPWLRLLRPGFRHCFVVLRANGRWVVWDSLAHRFAVRVTDDSGLVRLLVALARRGDRILPARPAEPPPRKRPLRPFTCVEASLRLLGRDSGAVLTPYALFRTLRRESSQRP